MKIELVDEKNYKLLEEWWSGHKWPVIPFSMLPKIGFIIDNTVAGFIYSTDSQICLIEWIISDPKSEAKKRKDCLNFLLTLLTDTAKDLGFKCCFTFVKNKGLIDSLQKNGFEKTDKEMIHFVKRI